MRDERAPHSTPGPGALPDSQTGHGCTAGREPVDRAVTRLLGAARATAGFMPDEEGVALLLAARRAAQLGLGPVVEVGSYLGRSTLYLAAGLVAGGSCTRPGARGDERPMLLYCVDHHRGSEEMQTGWEHHDASLVDPATGMMDSLPSWRSTISRAGVEGFVVAVVGDSAAVAADWSTPCSLVLLDGGHGAQVAWADFRGWERHVAPGGLLAIHDVFPDPADGGRPPYECFTAAISSGRFVEEGPASRGSLRVLRRRS